MVRPNYIRVLAVLTAMLGLITAGLLLTAKPAHAATFTVNSTDGDFSNTQTGDGICDVDAATAGEQCTIRAAIEEANASVGVPDVINFDILDDPNIPGNEVKTINVGQRGTAHLPSVTDPVIIDGYSQGKSTTSTTADDAAPNTLKQGTNAKLLIELNGQFAGGGPGLSIDASNSVVKGLIINRFGSGIEITGSNDKIEGNFIGTNAAGTGDQGNAYGVELGFPSGGSNNVVGGTTPAARNLISGNDFAGIGFTRDASANKVEGNLIGTQKDGTSPLGNSKAGVEFIGGSQNTIGGTTPAAANTIAHNTGDGVSLITLFRTDGTFVPSRDRILGNSIFTNGGLGIDLTNDGRTENDTTSPPPDSDTGENELQNFPDITSAKPAMKRGKKVTAIKGTLVSTPNLSFTIQLFSNPSGEDEGKTFIGQVTGVKTDSSGNASFSKSVARKRAPVGSTITATATDFNGNTSEFADPNTVS